MHHRIKKYYYFKITASTVKSIYLAKCKKLRYIINWMNLKNKKYINFHKLFSFIFIVISEKYYFKGTYQGKVYIW